jgi:hypothetical protein
MIKMVFILYRVFVPPAIDPNLKFKNRCILFNMHGTRLPSIQAEVIQVNSFYPFKGQI